MLVVYVSRFGNTQLVAEALARGIARASGVRVECCGADEATPEQFGRCDLLAVGGPTEVFSASKPMKAFLDRLAGLDLRGKQAVAFETKLHGRLAGSAAKYIERRLSEMGMEIVHPSISLLVRGMNKEERARYGDVGAPEWARRKGGPSGVETNDPKAKLDLLIPGWQEQVDRSCQELNVRLALSSA